MKNHLLLNRRRFLRATGAVALIGAAEAAAVPRKRSDRVAWLIGDPPRCIECR